MNLPLRDQKERERLTTLSKSLVLPPFLPLSLLLVKQHAVLSGCCRPLPPSLPPSTNPSFFFFSLRGHFQFVLQLLFLLMLLLLLLLLLLLSGWYSSSFLLFLRSFLNFPLSLSFSLVESHHPPSPPLHRKARGRAGGRARCLTVQVSVGGQLLDLF